MNHKMITKNKEEEKWKKEGVELINGLEQFERNTFVCELMLIKGVFMIKVDDFYGRHVVVK